MTKINKVAEEIHQRYTTGELSGRNASEILELVYDTIERNLTRRTSDKHHYRNPWWTEALNNKRIHVQKLRRKAQRSKKKNDPETSAFLEFLYKEGKRSLSRDIRKEKILK